MLQKNSLNVSKLIQNVEAWSSSNNQSSLDSLRLQFSINIFSAKLHKKLNNLTTMIKKKLIGFHKSADRRAIIFLSSFSRLVLIIFPSIFSRLDGTVFLKIYF